MPTNTPPDSGHLLIVQMSPAALAEMIEAATRKALVEREEREGREEPSPYMSRRAGADFIGVCEEQLARLAKAGKVKSYNAGRHLRFKREDLIAYIEGSAK